MTSVARYLVIADYQRSTNSVSIGARAHVLFVDADGDVAVVVRSRAGHLIQQSEEVVRLANFRVKRVVESTCSPAAWRWARPTLEDCGELLLRCKELRARARTPPPERES